MSRSGPSGSVPELTRRRLCSVPDKRKSRQGFPRRLEPLCAGLCEVITAFVRTQFVKPRSWLAPAASLGAQ
jgi:hypothetical protein